MQRHPHKSRMQHGALLIEVLITLVIVVTGLWGMAKVQARLQLSEMESYQRAQALLLLNDMASRMATNRAAAGSYAVALDSPLGVDMNCPAAGATPPERDLAEWCDALQGAAETLGTGSTRVGAMIGGRGCVEDLGGGQFMVTIAWQGMTPIVAPPASVGCGKDRYDGAPGTPCQGDLCRRAITTIIGVAAL